MLWMGGRSLPKHNFGTSTAAKKKEGGKGRATRKHQIQLRMIFNRSKSRCQRSRVAIEAYLLMAADIPTKFQSTNSSSTTTNSNSSSIYSHQLSVHQRWLLIPQLHFSNRKLSLLMYFWNRKYEMTRSLGTVQARWASWQTWYLSKLLHQQISQKNEIYLQNARNLRHFRLLAAYSEPGCDIHIDFDTNEYLNFNIWQFEYLSYSVLELYLWSWSFSFFKWKCFQWFCSHI